MAMGTALTSSLDANVIILVGKNVPKNWTGPSSAMAVSISGRIRNSRRVTVTQVMVKVSISGSRAVVLSLSIVLVTRVSIVHGAHLIMTRAVPEKIMPFVLTKAPNGVIVEWFPLAEVMVPQVSVARTVNSMTGIIRPPI